MKKVTPNYEERQLVLGQAIQTLDAQGLHDDDVFLSSAGWEVCEDVEDHVTFEKTKGVLKLTGGQSEENDHRVKWELTIHANSTQIGYASIVLRPGDMNGSTVGRLVKEALVAGEEEFKKWSDALSTARALLQA